MGSQVITEVSGYKEIEFCMVEGVVSLQKEGREGVRLQCSDHIYKLTLQSPYDSLLQSPKGFGQHVYLVFLQYDVPECS